MKPFGESFYIGPDLSEGPLPTLFYFALSAQESLATDPYNQPALYLEKLPLRIFSLDLPAHGPHLAAVDAIKVWAEEFSLGRDIITPFVKKSETLYLQLKDQGLLIEEKIGVAGLSRGAFIACHVAAALPSIKTILGFAPLTQLIYTKEFKELPHNPLAEALNLTNLVDALCDKTIRFYIGNLDKRVGTHRCFHFIESLSEAALHTKRIRSPQIELLIKPSIGHQGHGTSKEIFHEGAEWMAQQLLGSSYG